MATKKKKVVEKTPTKISKLQSELNYQRAVNQELMEKLNPQMKATCDKAEADVNLSDVNAAILKSNENLYNLNSTIASKIKTLTGKEIASKDYNLKLENGLVGEMMYHSNIVISRTIELEELLTVLFKTI